MISTRSMTNALTLARALERRGNVRLQVMQNTLLNDLIDSIDPALVNALVNDPDQIHAVIKGDPSLGTTHDVLMDSYVKQIADKLNTNLDFLKGTSVPEVELVYSKITDLKNENVFSPEPVTVGIYKDEDYFLDPMISEIRDYLSDPSTVLGNGGAELNHQIDMGKVFERVVSPLALEHMSENPGTNFIDMVAYPTFNFLNTNDLYTVIHILYACKEMEGVSTKSANGVLADAVRTFEQRARTFINKVEVGSFIIPNRGEDFIELKCGLGYTKHVHINRGAMVNFCKYLGIEVFDNETLELFLAGVIKERRYASLLDLSSRNITAGAVATVIEVGRNVVQPASVTTLGAAVDYILGTELPAILTSVYGEEGYKYILDQNGGDNPVIELEDIDGRLSGPVTEEALYDLAIKIVGSIVYPDTNVSRFLTKMNGEIDHHGENVSDAMLVAHMDNLISFLLEQVEVGE